MAGWFDFATNKGRFTPQAAGYYNFNASVLVTNLVASKYARLLLRRNGVTVRAGRPEITASDAAGGGAMTLAASARANGSTDYFELMVEHNNTSNIAIVGTSNNPIFTYWQGRFEGIG